jgi:sortase A
VALCEGYVAGLREDGRLYLGGKDSWGIEAAASWTDIIAIEGGRCHLLGLKADGTVLATGLRDAGQCDVEEWILRQPPVSAATTPAPTKPAGQGSAPAPQATPTPAPQMTQTPVPEADPTPTPAPYATPAPTTTPEPSPYVTPEPRPIWERVPGYEMPVTDAEVAKDVELKFVGILNIPALNVKLPIQSTWSYEQLAYTPCRYAGSCYSDGFVIIAHRFDSHFAGIGSLTPGTMITFTDMNGNVFRYNVVAVETLRGDQNEELLSKDYAMSLMTCTLSSSQRIVVRCERD